MKAAIKNYTASTKFSTRQIQARNKKEAEMLFRQQLGVLVSESDKVIVK